MIYIDPPYNTGNDFVYHDDFRNSIENYKEQTNQTSSSNPESNGRFHTDWLNMMYPRLILARNLLSNDDVIFISIDDNEIDNLKYMCNEIFGEINCVAEIPWQSRSSIQNDTDFSINHEYILVYAKKRRIENRRLKESNTIDWHKRDSFVCRPLPLDKSKFDNPDNDPRGLWKADPFDAPNVRPNLSYVITNPLTGEKCLPPEGRHWRVSQDKFNEALADGRIVFGKNGTGRPQMKSFYEEKKEYGSVDNSWFSSDKVGTTSSGTKEVMKIFDGESFFDKPKPTTLIEKLLTLANTSPNDIVLDFFSGSATTAHSIFKYNDKNNDDLKFILVQLPELVEKEAFNTICDIGEERIRRAGEQIKAEWEKEHPSDGLFGSDEEFKTDIGFKVFKLDSTNINEWDPNMKLDEKELTMLLGGAFKEDRSKEDILYEIMLKYGVFDKQVEEINVNGKTMYRVGKRYMIVCLEDCITSEDVKAIAELLPRTVIFNEAGFMDDNSKINAVYNLEKSGVEDIKCI